MPERQKLEGKRFGKWTVLEYVGKQKYLCRCDCGTEKVVKGGTLKEGRSLSCGCSNKRFDYIGKKIDRLTVLRKLPSTKSYSEFECKCDCGKIIVRSQNYLTTAPQCCCPDCRRPNIEDLTGQRFGRLTAIRYAGKSAGKQTLWECRCDCGNTTIVQQQNLKNGHTKSCGCYSVELCTERTKTHGESSTRLYTIWHDMISRCYSEKHHSYCNYGGRGISVCDEWKSDFLNFKKWAIENGYEKNLSIDRIDTNGNYCPGNCRWATNRTQANNTRRNLYYTVNGEKDTLSNICRKNNLPYVTISSRVRNGWSIEKAISTPIKGMKKAGE